jgi:sulfonate transport system permease protein
MKKSLFKQIEWKDKLLALIVPILVLVAWQWAVSKELFSELLLIPPVTLLNTLVDLARTGDLTINIIASIKRVAVGFLIGGSIGLIFGVVMGLSPFMDRLIGPLVKACKHVPLFAWMPLIILLFGIGELTKVLFLSIGAFFPMLFNTYQGVSGIPQKYRELARVFDYKNHRYLTKIIIPGAMPSIITGVRLSLGILWMFLVGAELFGSEDGLGYMMTWGRQLFQIDVVMAGLVVIGVIGFIINGILEVIEKRVLRWRISFEGGIF